MHHEQLPPSQHRPTSGRPRSQEVTAIALKTALALACEEDLSKTTIERIAQASGISKAALYRRWPNAWTIVMEAFFNDLAPSLKYDHTISITNAFKLVTSRLIDEINSPKGVLLPKLFAAAQMDTDLQRAFLNKWITPRRDAAKEAIELARQRGEVRQDINPDLIVDMIYGAIYYRMAIPYSPLDRKYSAKLVDMAFSGSLMTPCT
ncbi:TetR/AcrR family transcriptional regulator [Pseudomonas aeruginosa]|uniref:TetR/AcrR family transcriptional regulator n=1 Tax=Pseudomonas aeruginosa TaxID=287 RepID=UPI000F823540|nr:TetR/AcrR family transcriptional regulator [Pseudomonas aeruginosa]RTT41019.1 TetR/AcrR family transcriptional regulator [Pseudomonas aeruginosa]